MKCFLILIVACIITCSYTVYGQVQIHADQIKKISIHSATAGLGGGTSADIEVINQDGTWKSYIVGRHSSQMFKEQLRFDDLSPKFITTIDPTVLNGFLNGIATIKPVLTKATFSITPQSLIAETKNNARSPIGQMPGFDKLITSQRLDSALAELIKPEDVMDAFAECKIGIIKYSNDTINLVTRNLCATKLPWLINKRASYDMAINNFVIAAAGVENMPNKRALSVEYLKQSICKYIDSKFQGEPIATFRWNYYYPENLKRLKARFLIEKGFVDNNTYNCKLRTAVMPANAALWSIIDMTKPQDINAVIKYAALLDGYFKSPNFVLGYYANKPDAHLIFSCNGGQSPYYSLAFLNKRLPELSKTDSTKVINFWATEPDDSSQWLLFPDKKALVYYHSITTPRGTTAPIYPKPDPSANWGKISETYYLFDQNGKVLKQGVGLR